MRDPVEVAGLIFKDIPDEMHGSTEGQGTDLEECEGKERGTEDVLAVRSSA